MKTTKTEHDARHYHFDDFRIDALKRHLLHEERLVHLSPKVFDTLLTLIRHHGRVLDKNELMETVWPDTFVEENNLAQNISAIRKVLADGRGESRYIVTVPGRGYQFVADVREPRQNGGHGAGGKGGIPDQPGPEILQNDIQGNKSRNAYTTVYPLRVHKGFRRGYGVIFTLALGCLAAILGFWFINQAQPPKAIAAPTKTLAVLPFKSLNAEESEQYLGTGMADALITKLSNIRQIIVRPTSSVLRTANLSKDSLAAGRELGVDFVIEGHVQRMDDRLRVTVQMIRTSDGAAQWAMPFDEKFTDVFAMQDSISEQAASALQLKLSGEERRQIGRRYTESTAAYQAYMKAWYLMNEPTNEKVKKSIEYYQQAIEIDPNYALAYAGLADSYMRLHARGVSMDKARSIDLARGALTSALGIDDTVPYAHSILGFIAFRYEWDFAKAEREFNRARELDPNYIHSWFGFYLMTVNRFAEADEEFERYRQARPLDAGDLSLYHYFLHQYDLAETELKNSLEIYPNSGPNHANLGMVYEQKGLLKEAIAEFRKNRQLSGKKEIGGALVAHAYAISGRKTEARKILVDMENRSTSDYFSANYMLAVVNAGLGEKEAAIACLERAYDEHSLGPAWLRFDPRLDGLRSEPRFLAFVRRVGL